VRWAQAEDSQTLGTIHVRSWQAAYRGLIPDAVLDALDIEGRAEMWRRLLADKHGSQTCTLVVDDDLGLAGFLHLVHAGENREWPGGAEVTSCYVSPEYWRRGVGTALMERALDYLTGAGATSVFLWVLTGNVRAQAFYEHVGLRLTDRTRTISLSGIDLAEVAMEGDL
jgi:ribosomal protein S18 acetylase RimI-like enzyme